MFTTSNIQSAGKTITKVTITDINALNANIQQYQNIANQVDAQGMDIPGNRQQDEITFNVSMGIIGHIITCRILEQNNVSCTPHLEEDGFYLQANETKIKVRGSFGKYPPCPEKQIGVFNIEGYNKEVGATCDYYLQVYFCSEFDLEDPVTPIVLYIVGGLHKDELTDEVEYKKQTLARGKVSQAITLDDIIHTL